MSRPAQQPVRIQRKRTKGWTMPPNTVYVGRPSKFGNPCVVMDYWQHSSAVRWYALFMKRAAGRKLREAARAELRGKNLACWCPLGQPCHADVLLEIANAK